VGADCRRDRDRRGQQQDHRRAHHPGARQGRGRDGRAGRPARDRAGHAHLTLLVGRVRPSGRPHPGTHHLPAQLIEEEAMPTKAWLLAALALFPFGPAPSTPGAGPGWGSHMMEVGYRFALAGRAAESQNFPLADYEVDELGESFEQVRVVPPPEDIPKGVKLDGLLDAYLRQTLPPLRKAAQ